MASRQQRSNQARAGVDLLGEQKATLRNIAGGGEDQLREAEHTVSLAASSDRRPLSPRASRSWGYVCRMNNCKMCNTCVWKPLNRERGHYDIQFQGGSGPES